MKHFAMAILVGLLSACVSTTSPTPSDIAANPAVERQRMIDTGYCRQESEAAAPMPRAVTLDAPAGYTVSGTYSQPGYLPSTFQANVEPQGTMMDAYHRGQMYAEANEDRRQAQRARNEIFAGCMAARGW